MIYLHATIKVKPGKMQEFLSIFENEYVPASERLGRKLVAQFKDMVSPVFDIIDIWSYDDLTHMQHFNEIRLKDEEYMEIAGRLVAMMQDEKAIILEPTACSTLK